tara:strand:+ start:331 stop:825 length:495 start_codon:yes stop_codon:yes gene_type:complete
VIALEKQLGLADGDLITCRNLGPVGGETNEDRHTRISSFFKEHILKHTDSREEQKYLIVSHYGTIINTQLVLLKMKHGASFNGRKSLKEDINDLEKHFSENSIDKINDLQRNMQGDSSDPSVKTEQAPFGRIKNCSLTKFEIKLDRETKKIIDLQISNNSSYLD